jgi:hypothetical protein
VARAIEFFEFCPKVLNLDLKPGQRVIAKVAFGPYNPCDLDGEEASLAKEMFGGLDYVPDEARKYVVLRLGRGSGKTTICAAYAVYEAVTHDISMIGPGDVPYVIIVAPDKATAELSVRMAREMIRGNRALETLVVSDTAQSITIRRPDGRLVKIEAFAATRGGSSIRGRTIIGFIFDEAEFFTSNTDAGGGRDYAVNDRDIFRALKPRLLPTGKGMLISTPWPVETLMGELFEENWGKPKTAVAIKAPTLLVRGNEPHIVAMVEDELAKDPENARRELFCEVDGLFGGEFFDVNALSGAMDSVQEFPSPFNPKWPVAVGCDLGFTRDSSALVVVQYDGKYYRTVAIEELRPKPGQPLKPSEVIEKFAIIAKAYGSSSIIADGYYRESLKEGLEKYNLYIVDAPEGAKGKAEAFQRTRSVLHEGHTRIPDVQLGRRMVQQAKLVTSKPSPGGTVTIKIPRKIGLGHGDIVSAWVLAVHDLAYSRVARDRVVYEPGTPEWIAESQRRIVSAEDKRQKDYIKKLEKEMKSGMDKRKYRQIFQNR